MRISILIQSNEKKILWNVFYSFVNIFYIVIKPDHTFFSYSSYFLLMCFSCLTSTVIVLGLVLALNSCNTLYLVCFVHFTNIKFSIVLNWAQCVTLTPGTRWQQSSAQQFPLGLIQFCPISYEALPTTVSCAVKQCKHCTKCKIVIFI